MLPFRGRRGSGSEKTVIGETDGGMGARRACQRMCGEIRFNFTIIEKSTSCATSHKEVAQFYSPMASSIASQWYSAYAEWYSLREFYGE